MQLHWRHAETLDEIERDHAVRHLREFEKGRSDPTDLWIDVASSSRHHRKGDEKVTIRCGARRSEIIASATQAEKVAWKALRRASSRLSRWTPREGPDEACGRVGRAISSSSFEAESIIVNHQGGKKWKSNRS